MLSQIIVSTNLLQFLCCVLLSISVELPKDTVQSMINGFFQDSERIDSNIEKFEHSNKQVTLPAILPSIDLCWDFLVELSRMNDATNLNNSASIRNIIPNSK